VLERPRNGVVTMAEQGNREQGAGGRTRLLDELPVARLKDVGQDLLQALGDRAVSIVSDKIDGLTGRLTDFAENGGPSLMAAVTGGKALSSGVSPLKAALSAGATGVKEKVKETAGIGSGQGGAGKVKATNIIEEADVGLPVRVVYDQWTQFEDFPSFTRKVEKVEQESDEKVTWRAQIFLSHRDWEATIMEQVPDERIVWHATGSKGYPYGTVTFHELTPDMTRILLVIEYYPQGFFEKTANLWRAQGRRVRSDFKHIKRHMMTRTILEQDKIEGWRGEIRDGEVVKTHEDALKEEQQEAQEEEEYEGGREEEPEEREESREAEGEYEEEPAEEPEEARRGSARRERARAGSGR
jgi:uncharacterized membrane protein